MVLLRQSLRGRPSATWSPAGTTGYSVDGDCEHSNLTITNPEKFWQDRYLVIIPD